MRKFLQKFTSLELRVLVSMGVALLVFLAIPETVIENLIFSGLGMLELLVFYF
jgi:hypothetical protein